MLAVFLMKRWAALSLIPQGAHLRTHARSHQTLVLPT